MSIFLIWKIVLARSLHGLHQNDHGCRGHCEGPTKQSPCGEVLAGTSSADVKKVPAWTPRLREVLFWIIKNSGYSLQ
jgi:hypothetical protein